jgi:hypothetical protein
MHNAHSLGDGISLIQVLLSLTDEDDRAAHVPDAVVLKDDSGALVTGVGTLKQAPLGCNGGGDGANGKVDSLVAKRGATTSWLSWRAYVALRVYEAVLSLLLFVPAVLAALVASEVSDTRTCLQWDSRKHKSVTRKVLRYTKQFPLDKIKCDTCRP